MSSQAMVDQVFRSIASERKRIPTWDVESILTRAVYRALSSNGQFSQALDHPPINVDKCLTTTDAQLQLKLVAEKLCKRVERRYEKKLLQQRERDRAEIARKLSEIRNEYAEQVDVKRRDLDRERVRLEESYVEKERNLRHKLEMQLAEKESALEITRKSLENRLAELNMNKEHLDRIKAEFHTKFASDVEKLNEEWERLSAKREELRVVFKEEFEEEQHHMKEKLVELENENIVLRKRLSENGTDLFEMRSKLSKMATLEEDLQFANEKLRREAEENHRLSRSKFEAERLKEENIFLKEEIERLTTATRQQSASVPAQSSSKPSDDLQQSKIRELKTIIRMMNDRITSLTSERDYLREMLRDAKRQFSRETVGLKQIGLERITLRSRRLLRDTDSSEDTSMSSSAVSECASDLRTIKERFATLENMAKTLDTTIDCVAAARSMTHDPLVSSPEPNVSENYDDFCRSLKRSGNLYSSPVKNVAKEIVALRLHHEIPNTAEVPKPEEQRMRDELTPRAVTLASRDSVREVVQESPADRNPQEDTPFSDHHSSKAPSEPPDQAASFAERLRARSEATRKLNFSQEFEERSLPIARKSISSGEGITALDSYLALFTTNSAAEIQNDSKNLKTAKLPSSNDIPFEVEDVQVDKPGAVEDEIDW
ncbi:unnamed protein product [Cylicocyclus nassatus]|uniref:Uncharacterized protein n=1 Tax=Cylicocyclus nassatus TaxID=53992 RepID=A0AA36HD72_CYLNA|nr:unnamed protein product [Cylicocyclus nassatus]